MRVLQVSTAKGQQRYKAGQRPLDLRPENTPTIHRSRNHKHPCITPYLLKVKAEITKPKNQDYSTCTSSIIPWVAVIFFPFRSGTGSGVHVTDPRVMRTFNECILKNATKAEDFCELTPPVLGGRKSTGYMRKNVLRPLSVANLCAIEAWTTMWSILSLPPSPWWLNIVIDNNGLCGTALYSRCVQKPPQASLGFHQRRRGGSHLQKVKVLKK